MNIRDCTADDVPWIATLAASIFRPLVEGYDESMATLWVDWCVRSDEMIAVRGDDIVGFAQMVSWPWAPTVRMCDLLHLFGDAGPRGGAESVAVVSAIWDHARAMGCRKMYIGSIFADLAPIGKRLGGRALGQTYVLEASDV